MRLINEWYKVFRDTVYGVQSRFDLGFATLDVAFHHPSKMSGTKGFRSFYEILGRNGPQALLQGFVVVHGRLFNTHNEGGMDVAAILLKRVGQ